MSMATVIEQKVNDAISPSVLQIENESHRHGGPATESHFKLLVVAEQFSGMSRVKRHQQLYGLLREEMQGGVHALALHLYSPEEWSESEQQAPLSPDCRGGSKADAGS